LGFCTGLVVLAVAAPASATPNKPYSAVLTAGADASGLTVTALITNPTTAQQQIGSANLTPPPGYTLSGGGSVSPGTFSVVRNVVELRNLNLAPGQSATATIDVTSSPCSAGSWGIIAKQANDFSGLPGNDLGPLTSDSNLVTSLCGAPCKKNSACSSTDAGNANGNAQVVTGKGKLTGQLVESANANNFDSSLKSQCASVTGYQMVDPNTYSLLAPSDRDKVATIIFNSATALDLSKQQICFEAPYSFTGAKNIAPVGSPPDYVGVLPDCTPSGTGPCHNRAQDTETPLGNNGPYQIVLVADIPAAAGDPRCG
jgi:hypothetical protein